MLEVGFEFVSEIRAVWQRGSGDVVKNSPGKQRLVPYTSSAAVLLMSCLSIVLIPRRTSGSDVIQSLNLGAHAHDWLSFLLQYFKKISNIKKYHHFHFSSTPRTVFTREHADTPEVPLPIL